MLPNWRHIEWNWSGSLKARADNYEKLKAENLAVLPATTVSSISAADRARLCTPFANLGNGSPPEGKALIFGARLRVIRHSTTLSI